MQLRIYFHFKLVLSLRAMLFINIECELFEINYVLLKSARLSTFKLIVCYYDLNLSTVATTIDFYCSVS